MRGTSLRQRMLARVRRPASPPGPGPAADRAEEPPVVHHLLAMGLVDADYLGAQTGESFSGPREAAAAFVRHGWAGTVSPHPLVSLAFFVDVAPRWRRRGTAAMLDLLCSEEGLARPWSPAFDPRVLVGEEDSPEERLRAVRGVLTALDPTMPDEVLLPTPPGQPTATYAAVRGACLETARLVRRQQETARPPLSEEWHESRDAPDREQPPAVLDPAVLVSVLVLVDGEAEGLPGAVASVLGQRTSQWELVIADRGCTPGAAATLRMLAAEDARITVVSAVGLGSGAAHDLALAEATGSYIGLLDPRARWRPDFLTTLLPAMRSRGARVGHAVACVPGERGQAWLGGPTSRERLLTGAHVNSNVLLADAELVRAVGGFDPELRAWDDHELLLRLSGVEPPLFVEHVGADAPGSGTGLVTGESSHWEWVALGRGLVDWETLAASVAARVPGRVSVVMPVYQDVTMTLDAVSALSRHSAGHDLEVIVVDNASDPEVSLALAAGLVSRPTVRLLRQPRNYNFALGSNIGLAASTGELVLFLNNDASVRAGWLDPLVARLADPDVRGVQPLLVYPDDTIQATGTVFLAPDAMPIHALAGHPVEDAAVAADLDFSAVTAAALLMRAEEVVALHGFDPIFVNGSEDVDLCLRAVERFCGGFAVEPRSVVEHRESKTPGRGRRISENRRIFMDRWRGRLPAPDDRLYVRNGFHVAHLTTDGSDHPAALPVVIRRHRGDESPRWGLKSPAPGGDAGLARPESSVVSRLATELRRRGQEVVTYRAAAHAVPAAAFDDVVVFVRGDSHAAPHPGKVNVLWLVAPGAPVERGELDRFELVYAEDERLARHLAERGVLLAGAALRAGTVDVLVADVLSLVARRRGDAAPQTP